MDVLESIWQFLAEPIAQTPWTAWRSFWLTRILEGRYAVAYFLPLLPILMLLRRDKLRIAIVLTGLAFLAYIFGALYAVFWLAACVAFHRLGERFAIECKRTDVLQIGPPLVAGSVIVGWHAGTLLLHNLLLPAEWNAWLFAHLRWIFPLGVRGLAWEPQFSNLLEVPGATETPQLVFAMFRDVHLIGTAYLTLRLFHYFSEIKRGNLPPERRSLLNFLAFVCYAPSLTQGPVERFAPFQDEMDTCHLRRSWRYVGAGLARIALGVLKNFIVAWYIYPPLRDVFDVDGENVFYTAPEQIPSLWLLYVGAGLQVTRLYLGFSGYCDVAVGIAWLFGYRQVENFRRPWLATSLRDMWHRWHITLSYILRDYVYFALGGNRRRAVVNVLVTFFICGIWHALVAKMAVWGLVMGIMVVINQHWVHWMKRLDERPASRLAAVRRGCRRIQPLPKFCTWLITQHAFSWSLLIMFGGVSGTFRVTWEMLRRLWAAIW